MFGCTESMQEKQEEYSTEWSEIFSGFQKRVASDDRKAEELVKKNDISGLISLVNGRLVNVDQVYQKVLDLYPGKEMWKLHSTSLYYLTSLKEQLEYQNDVNEAVLSGKPVQDLTQIASDQAAKTKQVGAELGAEVQKLGIKLENDQNSKQEKEQ